MTESFKLAEQINALLKNTDFQPLYVTEPTYITIYQKGETSAWLFDNFFNGNVGILLNPLTIIVNTIPLYYIIVYLIRLYNKIQKKN